MVNKLITGARNLLKKEKKRKERNGKEMAVLFIAIWILAHILW